MTGFVGGLLLARNHRAQATGRRIFADRDGRDRDSDHSAIPRRGITDVRPVLEAVATIERRTATAYSGAVDRFRRGWSSSESLAQLIERTILPELQRVKVLDFGLAEATTGVVATSSRRGSRRTDGSWPTSRTRAGGPRCTCGGCLLTADRWSISTHGGTSPISDGKGTELFYRSLDGTMVAVPVTLRESVAIGEPTSLFTERRESTCRRRRGAGRNTMCSPAVSSSWSSRARAARPARSPWSRTGRASSCGDRRAIAGTLTAQSPTCVIRSSGGSAVVKVFAGSRAISTTARVRGRPAVPPQGIRAARRLRSRQLAARPSVKRRVRLLTAEQVNRESTTRC
jgi:hypothetical protein